MKDAREHRITRLLMQMARFKTARAFCEAYGLDPTYINQLINRHASFGEKAARKLEHAMGLSECWLDADPHPLDDYKAGFDAAPPEMQGMVINFLEPLRRINNNEEPNK
jgi:cyanate lyase